MIHLSGGTTLKKYSYRKYLAHVIPCFGYGIFCGAVAGALIFFFKLLAEHLEEISEHIYHMAKEDTLVKILLFAGLIGFATIMYLLHKRAPEAKGGGIPRSEGILRGVLSFKWIRTLFGTIFGSMISFFCGVPLGSEGPSVLIGTTVGHLCRKPSKEKGAWDRYVMTGGAAAAFSVATGSPFTAIIFALEEVHKRFTPMLVLVASSSVLAATAVNNTLCSLFNINPILFDLGIVEKLELQHTGYILLLAVLVSLAVGIFDIAVAKFGQLMKKLGKFFPNYAKILLVFLLTGVIGLIFTEGLYSGRGIILDIVNGEKAISFLAIMLVIRVGMMLLTTSSGVTGGIFIPTLAIGALFGALSAELLVAIGMPESLFGTVVLLAMCAFMGGTMRAPLTAAAFFIESTAQFTNMFYVALVIFIVNFATEVFNRKPFYDSVLEDMEEVQNHGIRRRIVRFEMKVSENAFVVGKSVRDILWPHSGVVSSIVRGSDARRIMDNDGEKRLYVGDTITLRAQIYNEEETVQYLYSLVGNDYDIHSREIE